MSKKSVNKVILIGNLGQDPEVRPLPSGGIVANINIATTDSWKDRETGQQRENTEWHRVVFFNKTAEIVQQYLKKGAKVYVEGRLQTRKWQDQNGQDRYTTEIVGNEMQMLDTRPNGQDQGAAQGAQPPQGNGYPQQQGNPPPQGSGYPQQQGNGYPQQGNGYPQQQGNPPPQGNGYPPQGSGYPQQQGHPQQGNPPHNGQPPMPGGNNQHPPF